MPRKKKTDSAVLGTTGESISSITYPAKRKNIPPAGLEAQGVVREAPRLRREYNPHLPPVLRSATDPAATLWQRDDGVCGRAVGAALDYH